MSKINLVTGYTGKPHVKSSDDGSLNEALIGKDEYVLERGTEFKASIITNNMIRIFDGDLLMQGRHARIDGGLYEDLYFDNGAQGYYRKDLIVARYERDSHSNIETISLAVVKGVPNEISEPDAPAVQKGRITDGNELKNEMILYEVIFNGISISEVRPKFKRIPSETHKWKLLLDVLEKTVAYRDDVSDFSANEELKRIIEQME